MCQRPKRSLRHRTHLHFSLVVWQATVTVLGSVVKQDAFWRTLARPLASQSDLAFIVGIVFSLNGSGALLDDNGGALLGSSSGLLLDNGSALFASGCLLRSGLGRAELRVISYVVNNY